MAVETNIASPFAGVVYPDSDGRPTADNTLEFEWIVLIKENLDDLFRNDPDVFVAGDLLWYPAEGNNVLRVAPDAMVAFGRPKGYRGSYRQWEEDSVAPQVVFEILSPGNRTSEMARKFDIYDRYGVEEYYIYDPDRRDFTGWIRLPGGLRLIEEIDGWTSPRLGVRFVVEPDEDLQIFRPDGEPFASFQEIRDAQRRAEQARDHAEQAQRTAEEQRDRLADKLREMGIDPNMI